MQLRYFVIPIFVLLLSSAFGIAQEQALPPATDAAKATLEDVIPLTMGNLRGHKMLYDEGWFVITSSRKALAYAREKSIIDSKTALRAALDQARGHAFEYGNAVIDDAKSSIETGRNVNAAGFTFSKEILSSTHKLGKAELDAAHASFDAAMERFVTGNLSIAKRTEEDRKELAAVPGNYYHTLKHDFTNLYDLTEKVRQRFSDKIDPQWEQAFQRASREFRSEYERSGEQSNSLAALGPILYGYLKSFYHGLAAPASKTIVRTTIAGADYVVFLPVAATSVVAGRTVQSVGLTVYYTGKAGVKIISPTIEGGLLSGLSLLSLSTVPVTYTAGGAIGAVNQVAFTAAGTASGAAQEAVTTGVHTAEYVGLLTFDAATGASKVVINQAASGVVLGYNALTAIPTQTLLGAANTAWFLAWDGPKLVIATARGKVKYGKDSGEAVEHSLDELPVGTVVDLKKLKEQEGVSVEVISEDPVVIRNVLEKIPDDMRVGDEKK